MLSIEHAVHGFAKSGLVQRIPWSRPVIWGNEVKYATEAVAAKDWSIGPYLRKIETEFGAIHGLDERCLAVANGTASLHLAYLALGIGPGDEIIVPAFCFAAAANMALLVGAKLVFVDVDPDTWLMNIDDIIARITKRTRAVVLVHTYGPVCDTPELMRRLQGSKIIVIEDCAESPFSKVDGQISGSIGHIASWSLQSTKTISCGEGGFVAAQDAAFCDRMRLFRSHGMTAKQKYYHIVPGHNFRLTNIQAAIVFAQLENRDAIIKSRRRIYSRYLNGLSGLPMRLQHIPDNNDALMWAVGIIPTKPTLANRRAEIMEELEKYGVEVRPGFSSASIQPQFEAHDVPISDLLGEQLFSLPFPSDLADAEIDYVIESLEKVLTFLG